MRQIIVSLLLMGFAASGVDAAVELRWEPQDQTIPLGGSGHVSVMIDEPLDLRTIELWVEFDPGILTGIHGQPGELFYESGCTLFSDFQDDVPGQWYGTAIALGFDCWLTGPGELYRWDFDGHSPGFSPVNAVQVRLYDPDAVVLEDVTLPGTHVFVGNGTEAPLPPPSELGLRLHPNPFNPTCRIELEGRGAARLEVFDLSGHRVSSPWSGVLGETERTLTWTGRNDQGQPLPSGVYLFRLVDERGNQATRRGLLIK